MSKALKTDYVAMFRGQLEDIDKLVQTPDTIKAYALNLLKNINRREVEPGKFGGDTIGNAIKALENIKDSSIRENYAVIYTQLNILATSALEAVLKKYFSNSLNNIGNVRRDNPRLKQIKVTALNLVENNLRYTQAFSSLILENEKNEFQNLKKIKDVFRDYFGKDLVIDGLTEESLIFYIECRHVLVHRGGVVDDNFLRNVTVYREANLKHYKLNDKIIFDDSDWSKIRESYTNLIKVATNRT